MREPRVLGRSLARALGPAVLATIGVATPAKVADAEPTTAEIAAAHDLFEQGLKLEESGDWQQALDRFRKVAAVKTTPQVRFHVALCLEKTGKLVDALVEFERAQAQAAGEPGAQIVATSAAKHVADLKARIPRVVVRLPADLEGAKVSIDGASVTASLAGTPIPLDPGAHEIVVTAPERVAFSQKVELVERGPIVEVTASLPKLAPAVRPASDTSAPPRASASTALPWIVGGVGAAALVGAGVLYGLRASTISELESACTAGHAGCPEDKHDVEDRGRTYTTVGNVLAGVGVVGLATAVILVVSTKTPTKTTGGSARVRVADGPGTFGLGLAATF